MKQAKSPSSGFGEVLSSKEFRSRLGQFPTGVGIVTTRAMCGEEIGLTINSFVPLSLEPPLVAWSLSDRSANLAAFKECSYFGISILAADQASIARRFADPATRDKFECVQIHRSIEGIPIISGSISAFVCESYRSWVVGDHLLLAGKVLQMEGAAGTPLVFHSSQFTTLSSGGHDE